jgi:translation initiation factor 5A
MLKGRPCRVIELSTSKDSKHGYGQACITGVDIFTGQKCEESKTTTATIQVPIVTKEEYPVVAL